MKHDAVAENIRKCYGKAGITGDFSDVNDVCHASGEAKRGSLFVCLRGAVRDGHDYAADAYRRGCRHFLCDRALSLPQDASVARVAGVRTHLFELLSIFYGYNPKDFTFVAVTGTKGKTTTALMLYHILKKKGYKVACSTTLGMLCDASFQGTKNTTPDLFPLSRFLSDAWKKGIRYIILEVSSAALSGGRVIGIPFSLGILTSFSKDHVGKGEHGSMAEYLCAKKSLFSSYGIKTAIFPDGVYRGAFIVSDAKEILSLASDGEVVSCVKETVGGQEFLYAGEKIRLFMSGAHNRLNARLAFAAASVLTGERECAFFSCLENFCIPGRFEQILHKGVIVVIDYAHNSESFRAISSAVEKQTRGRKICVFGSVGERGEARRAELAAAAERFMDFSVITEDDSGKESPIHICAQIYAAFKDKTRGCIVLDRAQAIRHAFSLCREGDALLLLGKGHEQVIRRREGEAPFSEREIVSSL